MLIHKKMYYQFSFCMLIILTLNPIVCLIFWLVLVFVNSPIGTVCAHFTGDIIAVPLILDNTQKPSQVLRFIKGNA